MNDLVAHLHDVIDAWFDINGEHITDQSIKDLKETLHLTTKAYYE